MTPKNYEVTGYSRTGFYADVFEAYTAAEALAKGKKWLREAFPEVRFTHWCVELY